MTLQYVLRCRPGSAPGYFAYRPDGTLVDNYREGEKAPPAFSGANALILCGGPQILITRAKVPKTRGLRLRQAVPYVLEEDLAEEVEKLHFALAERDGVEIPVAVLSHAFMREILDSAAAVGVRARRIYPELLVLPYQKEQWSLLCLDETALVRTGPYSGFSCELENLETLLNLALHDKQHPPPRVLCWYRGPHTTAPPDLDKVEIPVEEALTEGGEIEWLGKGLSAEKKPLNLAQGGYQPVSRYNTYWRHWRVTLGILLLWPMLQAAAMFFEDARRQQQEQALKEEIVQIYRDSFPDARKIVSPQVQMEQALDELRGKSSGGQQQSALLPLLAQASASLARPGVRLKRLGYRKQRLEAVVELKNVEAYEQLKTSLEARNLAVEARNISSRREGVEASLAIRFTAEEGNS